MSLPIVRLLDTASGTTAHLMPELGFNCYRLEMPVDDRPIEVLWSEPGFETGERRPSGSGIPLLFPFPGRIAGTTLKWRGESYELTAGDGRGNAIHGFVLDRPWRILEQSASHVRGQFQASVDDPEILRHWPADFRITAEYRVGPQQLDGTFLLENPDSRPLPCGFGAHPYFALPVGGARAEDCLVQLPVRDQWELRDMLPTGRVEPLPEASAYQAGRPFERLQLDNVFTNLLFDERRVCRAQILDPASGVRVRIEFNDLFGNCVVYTPPHREAICIEPYSCLPGAFHLLDSDVPTGIAVLEPGQSLEARLRIRGER